jgi:hypothetical protein
MLLISGDIKFLCRWSLEACAYHTYTFTQMAVLIRPMGMTLATTKTNHLQGITPTRLFSGMLMPSDLTAKSALPAAVHREDNVPPTPHSLSLLCSGFAYSMVPFAAFLQTVKERFC